MEVARLTQCYTWGQECGGESKLSKAEEILKLTEDGVDGGAAYAAATGSTVASLGTLPNGVVGVVSPGNTKRRKKKPPKPLQEASKRLNFDRMSPSELMDLWQKSQDGLGLARKLFPDCPKGYVRCTRNIGHLAANLATLRNNPRNKEYEMICYDIFRRLPPWAKEVIKVSFS